MLWIAFIYLFYEYTYNIYVCLDWNVGIFSTLSVIFCVLKNIIIDCYLSASNVWQQQIACFINITKNIVFILFNYTYEVFFKDLIQAV